MRAAFEFRHESWFDDEVFETLRACGAVLCIADTEKLETPKVITTDYGYLRLRREDYAESDVEGWTKLVREQEPNWLEAFVYFKHEEAGTRRKRTSQRKKLQEQQSGNRSTRATAQRI